MTCCTKKLENQVSSYRKRILKICSLYLISETNAVKKINCFTLLGCIVDNIEIVGNNLYGEPRLVENHGSCIEECKKTQRCVAWTLKEGFCYLKNESGILRTGGTLTYSGSKNCNDTKGMSHS